MKKLLPLLLLCLLCSCTKEIPEFKLTPNEEVYFDTSNNLSGDAYDAAAAETMMRALELCYSMEKLKITFNNGKVVYYSAPSDVSQQFVDDFYSTLEQLAYSPNAKTRGIWSLGKTSIDWYKALSNTNTVYRCAVVGAVTENFDKNSMVELYNKLMQHKEDIFRRWGGLRYVTAEFEQENFSTAGRFWYHFSRGDLDSYARKIYDVILNPQTLADCGVMTDPLHELAFILACEDLTPNRLMLSAAGPLLEAGFNTVFAADDVAGYAKLGYDILNDNTKLMLDLKNGKLNTKTLMTAVNTNLGLLSTCIDKIVGFDGLTGIKDTQDLGSVITTFCVENGLDVTVTIKDLNNLISDTLTDMGKWKLSVNDLRDFSDEVKKILGVDAEYECPDVMIDIQTYTIRGGVIYPFSEGTQEGFYTLYFDQVKVKKVNDRKLHIEADYNTSATYDSSDYWHGEGKHDYDYYLSFDVENYLPGKPENMVVTNVQAFIGHYYKGPNGWSRQDLRFGAGKMTFLRKDSYNEPYGYIFGGVDGKGVNSVAFTDGGEGASYGDSYPYITTSYHYNPENEFTIQFQIIPLKKK